MEELIAIDTSTEPRPAGSGPVSPLDPQELVRHAPDGHCVLLRENGETSARGSLWWRRGPSLPGEELGMIGHYAARDGFAARKLLRLACDELRARGCTLAVGPMDGSTWRHYRLLTERGSEPVFFLEPDNPNDWPGHFLESGFEPLAVYFSAMTADLRPCDPRVPEIKKRLESQGVHIRPLDTERLDDEFRRIHTVSLASFRNNFLYGSISEPEFREQYSRILPFLRPELVLIAEQGEKALGFIFALPDLLQARRGQAINTVIIKTLAVLPERAHAGLGSLLLARCQEVARDLGYGRAIHALMHETNYSRNLSRRYANTMRRYTLFARRLR